MKHSASWPDTLTCRAAKAVLGLNPASHNLYVNTNTQEKQTKAEIHMIAMKENHGQQQTFVTKSILA